MKNIKVTPIINPLRRNCNFTGSGNNALRGLVKFDPTVAYNFCLDLPATFSQSSTSIILGPQLERGLGNIDLTNI